MGIKYESPISLGSNVIAKGPRSYLCTQVDLFSSEKKGIAALLLKVIFFVNALYQLSEKNTPYFC